MIWPQRAGAQYGPGPRARPGIGSDPGRVLDIAHSCQRRHRECGAGTVLGLGIGIVVIMATMSLLLLSQAAVAASRAAAAADLAALAAADAARGITAGEPCAVARDVAARNNARLTSCLKGAGETVQVGTEVTTVPLLGPARGLARAGPPPALDGGPAP